MRSFALVLALALALTGCIQNMSDLKDRLGADGEEPVEPAASVDQTPVATSPEVNTTKVTKAPVARISVFAGTGALLFKSTFQADDPAEIVVVAQDDAINAIASDSEALEPGATIASYAWTLDGKPVAQTRQAALTMDAGGLHQLTLTVTDSHGKTDTQSLKIGVQAPAFDVVTDLATGAVAGVLGRPESADVSFELKLADAKVPATITAVTFVASPDQTCDISLEVFDVEEKSVGRKNDADQTTATEAETITTGALPEGTYTIRVTPQACPPQTSVPIQVTVTYLPTIEGVDPHGGHAH